MTAPRPRPPLTPSPARGAAATHQPVAASPAFPDEPSFAGLADLEAGAPFADRHIGPSQGEQARMLATVGFGSVPELLEHAVPPDIRTLRPLQLPPGGDEASVLAELRALAARNQVLTSMIGLGYHGTVTPPVIARNVLENPAWYTAYTPYQPEIAQGRLEALLTFQTMVSDLTGLPVAGASLLDEATAAAEAMLLARRTARVGSRDGSSGAEPVFVVDADTLPQTLAVLATRAAPVGVDLLVADLTEGLDRVVGERDVFGVLVSYPTAAGRVVDYAGLVEQAHARGALVTVAADPLALTLLRPPGEFGADIAVGSTQRFGVPMGFGGPHAAYMAVRAELTRSLPGRLVGVSVDADGRPAYRLALQTREQHIRRERATSNICTAQVLLAVVAGFYAAWHGPAGLRRIARRAHRMAVVLAAGLRAGGVPLVHDEFFDTVIAHVPGRAAEVLAAARTRGINLRPVDDDHVGVTTDETTTRAHLAAVWAAFGVPVLEGETLTRLDTATPDALPDWARRTSPFLTHPVFHTHHSEAAMVRYLRRLADADLALDRTMIPLGSCTMKLNAAAEMAAMTWPEFTGLHPFAPLDQAAGTLAIIEDLTRWLADLTGYDAVSLQPNAGSQGELAGLLAIRAYHRARGQAQRTVCLIPASAHGTNAASAVLAGLRVVVVACDAAGNIDLDDLRAKLAAHSDDLAAIMITYPSTHGVYEASIAQIAALVHDAGGQVYVDGANLNALVGIARPGEFGADVSHLNLHKTFTIPHGGGGPGVGPIGVRSHLAPYLPSHPLVPGAGPATGIGPVSAAPWGSAGVLQISWAYLRLMGPDGLTRATGAAVLAANYLARRLAPAFPVLYTGPGGLVAHECILDLRPATRATGVSVDDVAKRLIDFGFHAPTVSFPVAGTLMVEPTESEDLAELDRFVDAMLAIRAEIDALARGELDPADNPLRNAPHTASMLTAPDGWTHPYPPAQGVFPAGSAAHAEPGRKYWPPVRRIDQPYGDRHLVCSCPPLEAYQAAEGGGSSAEGATA